MDILPIAYKPIRNMYNTNVRTNIIKTFNNSKIKGTRIIKTFNNSKIKGTRIINLSGGSYQNFDEDIIVTIFNNGGATDKFGYKFSNQCFFLSVLDYLQLNMLVNTDFDISDVRGIGGLELSQRRLKDIGLEDSLQYDTINLHGVETIVPIFDETDQEDRVDFIDVSQRICKHFNVNIHIYHTKYVTQENSQNGLMMIIQEYNIYQGIDMQNHFNDEASNGTISIYGNTNHFQLIVQFIRAKINLTKHKNYTNFLKTKKKKISTVNAKIISKNGNKISSKKVPNSKIPHDDDRDVQQIILNSFSESLPNRTSTKSNEISSKINPISFKNVPNRTSTKSNEISPKIAPNSKIENIPNEDDPEFQQIILDSFSENAQNITSTKSNRIKIPSKIVPYFSPEFECE